MMTSKVPPVLTIMQAVPGFVARLDLARIPTLDVLVDALKEFDVELHFVRCGTRIDSHFWRHEGKDYSFDTHTPRVAVVTDLVQSPDGHPASVGVEAFINSLPELTGTEEVFSVQFAFLRPIPHVQARPIERQRTSHVLLRNPMYAVPGYISFDVIVNGDGHYEGVEIVPGDKVILVLVEPDTMDEWDALHGGSGSDDPDYEVIDETN